MFSCTTDFIDLMPPLYGASALVLASSGMPYDKREIYTHVNGETDLNSTGLPWTKNLDLKMLAFGVHGGMSGNIAPVISEQQPLQCKTTPVSLTG